MYVNPGKKTSVICVQRRYTKKDAFGIHNYFKTEMIVQGLVLQPYIAAKQRGSFQQVTEIEPTYKVIIDLIRKFPVREIRFLVSWYLGKLYLYPIDEIYDPRNFGMQVNYRCVLEEDLRDSKNG